MAIEQAVSGKDNNSMSESKKSKKATTRQLEPGTLLLDRYLIVKRVGGGGMGSVYQAQDKRLADRLCAVKEMIELFADQSQREKAVDDFKREAEVLAQLEHPSIPTIFDYFIDGGRYYLVMKWIGGGDLAEQMRQRNGTVDEATVTQWAIQICDVLHFIHSQTPPIIYRDLKPANLMLDDKTGRVMLVDFGIARIVRPTEKGVTAIGTMGYAPPELFAGKVEPRSDIYSLGATMFHMLTGADPQDNPLLIFDFSKNPRPRQINPAISTDMEQILIRSVAHKPEERQTSAFEFGNILQDHSARLKDRGTGRASNSGRQIAPPYVPAPPLSISPRTSGDAGSQPIPTGSEVFCYICGEKIGADDVYCAHCGNRQPVSGAGVPPSTASRVRAQLMVMGGTEPKPFPINKDSVLIGRTDPQTGIFPEIDLTMYDPETKVSRRHARIYREGEKYLVEDLGSVNGTVLNSPSGNSQRLNTRTPRVLTTGDELKVGSTILRFQIV